MKKHEAKKIGGRKGMISSAIGIVAAYLIMAMMTGIGGRGMDLGWIADASMKLNMLVGAVIMLVSGYLWGQLASIVILIKNGNSLVVGMLCGAAALVTTAALSGWLGFFQEGSFNKDLLWESFRCYVFEPFLLITAFGIIPALVVGAWMGWSIKRICRQSQREPA